MKHKNIFKTIALVSLVLLYTQHPCKPSSISTDIQFIEFSIGPLNTTTILCHQDETLQDVKERYAAKTNTNPENIYFIIAWQTIDREDYNKTLDTLSHLLKLSEGTIFVGQTREFIVTTWNGAPYKTRLYYPRYSSEQNLRHSAAQKLGISRLAIKNMEILGGKDNTFYEN